MPKKTGARKHVHKYYKMPNGLFACGEPDCTHYMPGNVEFMMLGKASICWQCADKYIFGERQLKMEKPICDECILKNEGLTIDANELMKFLDSKVKTTKEFIVDSSTDIPPNNVSNGDDDGLI